MKSRIPSSKHWKELRHVGQRFMEPSEFLSHWQVDYQGLAEISGCSIATVKHWFCEGKSHRPPRPEHKFRLAVIHRCWLSL